MRRRRFNLATRSERDGAPVLICPAFVATARSAMVVSSVSPERWLKMLAQPAPRARVIASRVSVRVPIWFGFTSSALAAPASMARSMRWVFVTSRSSPTICTLPPMRAVSASQPIQSSSARPSSMLMIGYFDAQLAQRSTSAPLSRVRPSRSSL